MKKLIIAYFGTPYFSALFLEKLLTDTSINRLIEVKLVVTQPDKPVGKKRLMTSSPVKETAKKFNIPVLDSLRSLEQYYSASPETKFGINSVDKNIDLGFLFAYGGILPTNVLKLPKYGFWNTHPSLLPKYRGPSPIAYPLILGDKKTGVTLIKLDEKIDHGPIIAQDKIKINSTDRRPDLEIKLTDLAFRLFKKTVCVFLQRPLSKHTLPYKTQNHTQATFTRLLQKDDGFIPLSTLKKALNNEPLTFSELPKIIFEYINKYNLIRNWKPVLREVEGLEIRNSSKIVYDYFRGLCPWPGIWTLVDIRGNQSIIRGNPSVRTHKRLKITGLNYAEGKLTITKVQLEGKKEVDIKTFNKAYDLEI